MKLLLRGVNKKGEHVESLTREFNVSTNGDGVYNVPVPRGVVTITVSVVEAA